MQKGDRRVRHYVYMDMSEVIRARRARLGMSQAELAQRVEVAVRQVARYEAGEQQPAFNVAQRIANALDLTLDELAGSYSEGLDLSGDWHMSWQTWKDGQEYYTVQRVQVAQKNERLILVAERGEGSLNEGYYAWRGELRLWDNDTLMGWYAASDGASRSKGTLIFTLNPQGLHAHGLRTGISSDGLLTGRGGMARDKAKALEIAQGAATA